MYEVVRKGYIEVFRVGADASETFVSRHVDEAEAITAANTHGERNGGGRYRLSYPDKVVDVRIIVQGAAPTTPVLTVAGVPGSATELDITLSTPATGPGVPFTYELEEATAASGPFSPIAATFSGNPLSFRRAGLTSGQTRFYRVTARDAASPQRSSALSAVASGTTFDITPDAFDFTDVQNVATGSQVTSNSVTIQGIDTPVLIAVVGGQYSIDSGAFTSTPGLVSAGQSVRVRTTASPLNNTNVTVALTVGTRVVDWVVRTAASTATGFWPNWPIMNTSTLQGPASGTILNEAMHSQIADKDLIIIQSFYPDQSRLQTRIAALSDIKALQQSPMDTKVFLYFTPSETYKVPRDPPGNNEKEISQALINDPLEGHESWFVHRVGNPTPSGRVEAIFDPVEYQQVNMCVLETELNTLGENYAQAYWRTWNNRLVIGSSDIRPLLAGCFADVTDQRPPPMTINNGATTVNDYDCDGDGVADVRTGYGPGPSQAGRMWSEGGLETKRRFEERFPGKFMIPNGARWDFDYNDGQGQPPLPLSAAPMYRQWEIFFDEVSNFNLGLRIDPATGTSYRFTGGGSVSSFFRAMSHQEKWVKLEEDIPPEIGRGCVLVHSSAINRTPQQSDIEFIRFVSLLCLLMDRLAPSIQQGGSRPFSLDELLVRVGNPIGPRSMGTFNESTLAFTVRAADFSSGVARFYWAIFQEAIVVARTDSPTVGTWPTADAAVACTLPSPGAGRKWQMLGPNYTNPVTGRTTRNQTPSLNNGADVTQVSLRPYHACLVRNVPV